MVGIPNRESGEMSEYVGYRWEQECDWSPDDRMDELGIYDDEGEEEG